VTPRGTSPALIAVLAILGFLLVTAADVTRVGRRASEPRKTQLIELIEARRSQISDLDAAVDKLRGQVDTATRRAAQASRSEAVRADTASRLAMQAGTVAFSGPGVRVRLADSSRNPSDPDDANAGRVHDVDVQLVVNALFAAGAEAIAINGNRVVATTAIRSAGDTVVVNFRPLRPPYRVDAIGADLSRFEDSEIVERFHRWTRLFGLGFSARREGALRVPSYTGRVAIATATPAGAGE
jgi:uncharacterized protein YlxW (UPF0749 family)